MALDRATIVEKAFEVLAEKGVAGLSTRKLAEALGVSGPSLYWHFKTKRELFDHMTEAMLSKALAPLTNPPKDFDWVQWLGDSGRSVRREIRRRPGAAQVFVGYRPTAERIAMGPSVTMIVLSERTGLSLTESRLLLGVVGRFVVGWTQDEEAAPPGSLDDPEQAFEFALDVILKGAEVKAAELLAARAAKKAG